MRVNKQYALGNLVRIATPVAKSVLRKILSNQKVWRFVTENRLIGDIPFRFEAEIQGNRFQLQGPFRYSGGHYYAVYLVQGAYEPPVTAHITQVVRQYASPRVLDVGAHYGWYTLYLAKLIANRGVVFSFEPSEVVFSCLKQNVELNELDNVRLYMVPLSDKREHIGMVVTKEFPKEARYMSVIEKDTMDKHDGLLSAIPFDELNETEAIHPNIVKVDVRSVWRKVVDGMRESLSRDVEHLYLELDPPPASNDLSALCADVRHVISMMHDAGMDVYEIQNHRIRDGGQMVKADENRICAAHEAMLYGVKRR